MKRWIESDISDKRQEQDRTMITLAITGASGTQYGLRLLRLLAREKMTVYCLFSTASKVVMETEFDATFPKTDSSIPSFLEKRLDCSLDTVRFPTENDWFSAVASGSSAPKQMVVCPCSMGTLSAIACGASNNLIERAADVVLKENGKLILVPRETPLSTIHLSNMLTLSQYGATILPAMPSFYSNPKTIDDLLDTVVQRILDHIVLPIRVSRPWG